MWFPVGSWETKSGHNDGFKDFAVLGLSDGLGHGILSTVYISGSELIFSEREYFHLIANCCSDSLVFIFLFPSPTYTLCDI